MHKLGLLAALATIAGALTFATLTREADANTPCVTKDFKTELVKKACAEGGQKQAKKVMQAWNKEKKIKTCNACHTKLAPKYELKPDGLQQYKAAGGT